MYCSQFSIVLIFLLLSHTLPMTTEVFFPLFSTDSFSHNSLKPVIFSFFCFFLISLISFLFSPQWFFPGLLSSPYLSHHLARQLLLTSLSELWKQLFRSWFYLQFPFSMGLAVLMIRTGEMIYETNLDALKKINVAQTCCRDNMGSSSLY